MPPMRSVTGTVFVLSGAILLAGCVSTYLSAMLVRYAGFYLAEPRVGEYEFVVLVTTASMWGSPTLMEVAPPGLLSAAVHFVLLVFEISFGIAVWIVLIYGAWHVLHALSKALSTYSPVHARRSILVIAVGLLGYLVAVLMVYLVAWALLGGWMGGPHQDALYRVLLVFSAPAFGPASLPIFVMNEQLTIFELCPAIIVSAIANCLFWATLIYYGRRVIRRSRDR